MSIPQERIPYVAGLLDSSKGGIDDDGTMYFRHENPILPRLLHEYFGGILSQHPNVLSWYKSPKEDTVEVLKSLIPFLIRNKLSAQIAVRDLS